LGFGVWMLGVGLRFEGCERCELRCADPLAGGGSIWTQASRSTPQTTRCRRPQSNENATPTGSHIQQQPKHNRRQPEQPTVAVDVDADGPGGPLLSISGGARTSRHLEVLQVPGSIHGVYGFFQGVWVGVVLR